MLCTPASLKIGVFRRLRHVCMIIANAFHTVHQLLDEFPHRDTGMPS
jgi:hypothetical protein